LIESSEGVGVAVGWQWQCSVVLAHRSGIIIVVVNDVGGGGACIGVCTFVGRRFLELRDEIMPVLDECIIDCISALDRGGVAVVVVDMVDDGVGVSSREVKIAGRHFT